MVGSSEQPTPVDAKVEENGIATDRIDMEGLKPEPGSPDNQTSGTDPGEKHVEGEEITTEPEDRDGSASEDESAAKTEDINGMESDEDTTEDVPEEKTEVAETIGDDAQTGFHFPHETGILAGLLLGTTIVIVALLILVRRMAKKMKQGANGYYEDKSKTLSPMVPGNDAVKIAKGSAECPVRIASIHDVGRRGTQQDSFGISDTEDKDLVESKGILAVVADGMGGLTDGERMSQMVVVNMLQGFDAASPGLPGDVLLRGLVDMANQAVNLELGKDKIGKCGSTVVCVLIRDKKLSWISVGDSHIYVYRNEKLIKLNKDHNYGTQLDESVSRGEITIEEALSDPQRAALTSFIGIGELELVDQNQNPIGLTSGDRVLLMSDGIYGTVPFERLREIMGNPLRQACLLIDKEIHQKNKMNQDNYTCIILEMR